MNKTPSHAKDSQAAESSDECPGSGALDECRNYIRQNPGVVLLGALVLGAAAGALCCRPEEKPTRRAWDWLDDTRHRVSDEMDRVRKSQACRQGYDLFRNLQGASRNLKFW